MPGIKLVGTGKYLPEKIVSNDDFSKVLDTSDEWISQRTGIKNRRRLGPDETCSDMAVGAAKAAIENAIKNDENFSIDKIRAIYTATITGDYLLPSMSAIIQRDLGLPERVKAFDIAAACTGFGYALQSAYETLNALQDGYVLVVGCEGMSKILDFSDRSTCVLFGDAAGAAVVGYDGSEDARFIEIFGTRGDSEMLYCTGRNENGFVHMKGQEVFKFAVLTLRRSIDELLKKAGVTIDEIDQVVCHQANARIIQTVMKHYKNNEDKFYVNIAEYGNTSGASIPILMDDMVQKGLLKNGMKIIVLAFGAGLSWNGAYMTI